MDPALDRFLCFALYGAAHRVTRLYKPLLEALGLTYPQYLVMVSLWERDGRSVGELGALLDLDSGTLTPLLKRLEAAALIRRERDGRDERRVRVKLTADGRVLRGRAAHVPGCIQAALGLSPDRAEALRQELDALRGSLDGVAPPPPERRAPHAVPDPTLFLTLRPDRTAAPAGRRPRRRPETPPASR